MSKNKTENEFQSMTASQGKQIFFFSNVIIAFYRVFMKQFDTILLFQQMLPLKMITYCYEILWIQSYEIVIKFKFKLVSSVNWQSCIMKGLITLRNHCAKVLVFRNTTKCQLTKQQVKTCFICHLTFVALWNNYLKS